MAILKMATARNFSMSGHHNLPTYEMSLKSDNVEMWWPFWKWRQLEIFQCQESIRDIIIYSQMKCRWNQTMLNLCGIVVTILKMATGRNNGNQFGTSLSTHISNFYYIEQLWVIAVLWRPFWKCLPVEICQCRESISTHI